MSDPATDVLIAARFPAEWARANDPTLPKRGKARQKLRARYRFVIELEAFKARCPSARCANCRNLLVNPAGIKGDACDLDSDFHGYAMIAKPDEDVCVQWAPQRAATS